MKRKFWLVALALLFALVLTACDEEGSGGSNGGGQKPMWEELLSLEKMRETFGKELYLDIPCSGVRYLWNETEQMYEMRVEDASIDLTFHLRLKAATAWEDITTDLQLTWDTMTDDTEGGRLEGKVGSGTVEVETESGKVTKPFVGGIWYDAVDGQAYACISVGESGYISDLSDTFAVNSQESVDFADYEEAMAFLEYHLRPGWNVFMRNEGTEKATSVERHDNEVIVFIGDAQNNTMVQYVPEGVWKNEMTTDPETGIVTVREYSTWEKCHTVLVYQPGGEQIISVEGYREDGSYSWKNLYDETGFCYYVFEEDEYQRFEINFTATGGDKTLFIKRDESNAYYTFKTIINDGMRQHYYLTKESDYNTQIYTYASDDAIFLTRYQFTDHRDGTYEDWILDGCGKDTDNILSLTLTENGVTTYYTHDEVPWGKGMAYPPKNPGDFYFSY